MNDLHFSRQLSEDAVKYSIHIVNQSISEAEKREALRRIHSAGHNLCKRLLPEYVWQREGFRLEHTRQDGLSFLQGQTIFADSIEDEWLVVYLLSELSKDFESAWTQVVDADGEFLLAEAAQVLPRWLTPETADNRVWLNRGHLYIIPGSEDSHNPNDSSHDSLKVTQALHFIQNNQERLLRLEDVEKEAFHRVKRYPEQIPRNLHRAQVIIPRSLALILHTNPSYISSAVDALCANDPTKTSALQMEDMTSFRFPPLDLVRCPVLFAKVGFVQLKSRHISTPPVMPHIDPQNTSEIHQTEIDLGRKVTAGFEMLMYDQRNQNSKIVREINMLLGDIGDGDLMLPSNDEICQWGTSADDESWLDINYNDLERELAGQQVEGIEADSSDPSTLDNLRKMVARYEGLLKDDETIDDSEFDDTSGDDDDEASFDNGSGIPVEPDNSDELEEDDFTKLMRGMLGMSKKTLEEVMGPSLSKNEGSAVRKDIPSFESKVLADDDIAALNKAMESEIRAASALRVDGLDGARCGTHNKDVSSGEAETNASSCNKG